VLFSVFMEFGMPMKLVRLTKMCLNEIYSKVRIDRNLFAAFPIQNDL
jgi:hypothetical protein